MITSIVDGQKVEYDGTKWVDCKTKKAIKKRCKHPVVRILQVIICVHRIHHIRYSFGWLIWPFGIAYFKGYGLKRIHRNEYHDCAIIGIF